MPYGHLGLSVAGSSPLVDGWLGESENDLLSI
jgi:hypothetical protein